MSTKGMLTSVMATEIAKACFEDGDPGNIADGVFGLAMSKLLGGYAQYICDLEQEIKLATDVGYENGYDAGIASYGYDY